LNTCMQEVPKPAALFVKLKEYKIAVNYKALCISKGLCN